MVQNAISAVVQGGAGIDVFFTHHGLRIGVEIKRTSTPRLTPSMRIATSDLRLDRLVVVYPGSERYPLADRTEAVPLAHLAGGPDSLFT